MYAVRFSSNFAAKRKGLEDGEGFLYPCERHFRLVRAEDLKAEKSYLFATNMACRQKTVLRGYKRR